MNLKELGLSDGVSFHSGANPEQLMALEQSQIRLPSEHEDLLSATNGLEIFHGYFRIFGLKSTGPNDAIHWNDTNTWKFAWCKSLSEYWCFGETVWGDQLAYFIRELSEKPRVYLLDALTMEPKPLWNSFSSFFLKFEEWAKTGGASQTIAAFGRFGSLIDGSHLVYSPPIQISGKEDIEHAMKLNATVAMIFNGDLASQLELSDREPIKVEPYQDELGRTRLRVHFA